MSYQITIQYLVLRYEAFLFWVSLIKTALSYVTLFSIVKIPLFIPLTNVVSCSWLTGLIRKGNVFPGCQLNQNADTVCREKAVRKATGYQKPEGANMKVH